MKYAILFGQNAVDQFASEYNPEGSSAGGWSGLLTGCVPDARGLAQCAFNMGYNTRALFSGWNVGGPPAPGAPWVMRLDCTRDAWRQAHTDLQASAQPGDEFIIGNSGHGSQYPTVFGTGESMCFADGTITDSEFHTQMCGWRAGVKVVYPIDTCFSGGQNRDAARFTSKVSPKWVTDNLDVGSGAKSGEIKAAILQFCACARGETAGDGAYGGIFTGSLLGVWEQARLKGQSLTWASWFAETAAVVATFAQQHPILNVLGAGESMLNDIVA